MIELQKIGSPRHGRSLCAIPDSSCAWAGCDNRAEASLEGRCLCRKHFSHLAAKCLEGHRIRLSESEPTGRDRTKVLNLVSQIVSETTVLVANGKFPDPQEREKLLNLTKSATEFYQRVQRSPRVRRNMPILVCRETDPEGSAELTNTINVSKQGLSIATNRTWKSGEKVWVQRPGNRRRALARVIWVGKSELYQFLVGLQILNCEDFWGLQPLRSAPLSAPVLKSGVEYSC